MLTLRSTYINPNLENSEDDTLDTYGTYSLNNSSDESDVTVSKNSYQNKKFRGDRGALKVGRFVIAKSGKNILIIIFYQMKMIVHFWLEKF